MFTSEASQSSRIIPPLRDIILKKLDTITIPPKGNHFILENGMPVYIENRSSPYSEKGFAFVRLVVRTGDCAETEEEKQLAHFLEHCLFLGSDKYPLDKIEDIMKILKCKPGSDSNASTDLFTTEYYFNNIPLFQLSLCLDLLYHMIFKSKFPLDKIYKERDIINNEILMRKNYKWEYWEFKTENIHSESKLKDHQIKNFSPKVAECDAIQLREFLLNFYRKWYAPHNMALVIIGNFSDFKDDALYEKTIADIKNTFGAEPACSPSQNIGDFHANVGANPFFAKFQHRELPSSEVVVYIPEPPKNVSLDCIRKHQCELIDEIIKCAFLARTIANLIDPKSPQRGLKMNKTASFSNKITSFLEISGPTADNDQIKVLSIIFRIIRQLLIHGVSEEELRIYKKERTNKLEAEHKSVLVKFSNSQLANEISYSLINEGKVYNCLNSVIQEALVPSLSLTELNESLRGRLNIFNKRDLTIVFKSSQPIADSLSDVEFLYKHNSNVFPESFKFHVQENWLPNSLLSVNPIKTSCISKIKCKFLKFPNGSQAFLKTTTDPDAKVKISLVSSTGSFDLVNNRKEYIALSMAMNIISCLGIGDLTKIQTINNLRGEVLETPLNPILTLDFRNLTFSADCTFEKGIQTALQLIYSRITDLRPIFSKEFEMIFEKSKSLCISSYINNSRTGQGKYNRACHLKIWQNHELVKLVTDEEYNSVTLDECRKMALLVMKSLSDFRLVMTGNFQEAAAIPLVEKYLGNLPVCRSKSDTKEWPMVNPFQNPTQEILAVGHERRRCKTQFYIPLGRIENLAEHYKMSHSVDCLHRYLNDILRNEEQRIYNISTQFCGRVNENSYLNYFYIEFVTDESIHINLKETMLFLLKNMDKEENREKFEAASKKIIKAQEKLFQARQGTTDSWHSFLIDRIRHNEDLFQENLKINFLDEISSETMFQLISKVDWNNIIEMRLEPQSNHK